MANSSPRSLLTPQEAAERLGLSWRTLETWRQRGVGPVYVKLSKRNVRYRRADIEQYIAASVRTSTSAQRPPSQEVA